MYDIIFEIHFHCLYQLESNENNEKETKDPKQLIYFKKKHIIRRIK